MAPQDENKSQNWEEAQWIFRGNLIVPTGNPFNESILRQYEEISAKKNDKKRKRSDTTNLADPDDNSNDDDCLWLGPGLKILIDQLVVVDRQGIIIKIESWHEHFDRKAHDTPASFETSISALSNFVQLTSPYEFLCPGYIDLHIHAPQFSYTGTATDRPLMGKDGWLESYTFPAEQRLASMLKDDCNEDDPKKAAEDADNSGVAALVVSASTSSAESVYHSVVQSTLRNGTTTAVYFGTLHLEPCKVLVDAAMEHGQRALVGKVCMDRNVDYENYCHTTQQNADDTVALMEYIHERAGKDVPQQQQESVVDGEKNSTAVLPLVLPLVTPRFIPTCSPALMSALGSIASKYNNCHITSHLSESYDEVEYSRHLDLIDQRKEQPNNAAGEAADAQSISARTDSEIFYAHNLMTSKSIMAHCVHLTEKDIDMFLQTKSAIAHCPLSNFFFAGQPLPCRKLLEKGVKIGLGTDVAGGYSPSMWNASRMAVLASRALEQRQQYVMKQQQHQEPHGTIESNACVNGKADAVLDYKHAFYLATLGGAQALGVEDRLGTLQVGMEFDALIISADVDADGEGNSNSPVHVFDSDSIADIFQKICVLGDDRNVKRVFVQGKDVTNR